MLWLYGVVGSTTGVFAAIIFYLLTKNKTATCFLAGLAILLSAAMVKEYVMPNYYAHSFEHTLRQENPFMNLIAEKEPAEFKQFIAAIKNNILVHGNKANETYLTSELINRLLIKYGPFATADALYAFLKANIALDKKLIAIDPMLVMTIEFPDKFKGKTDPSVINLVGGTQALLEAKIAVIRTAIATPQPPLSEEEKSKAAGLIGEVIADLAKRYGGETVAAALQHPDSPKANVKKSAEMIIAFYETIAARGKDNASLMIKLMLAQSSAK